MRTQHFAFALVFGLGLGLALALAAALSGTRARAGEDEPASLPRALFLEKTAHDAKGALAVYAAVEADTKTSVSDRAEARLGEARCLLALERPAEAVATWKALLADPAAPAAAKDEARAR